MHVFTEVVPLTPYKLNVCYYTGKKDIQVLIGFDYSCFLPKQLQVKHYNSLWKAVLSQLASCSLTCLIQSLLRLISSPLTQTHHPCLLIFCDTGNYSPSNSLMKFQLPLAAAMVALSGCLFTLHQNTTSCLKLKAFQWGVSCKTFRHYKWKEWLKRKIQNPAAVCVSLPPEKGTAQSFHSKQNMQFSQIPSLIRPPKHLASLFCSPNIFIIFHKK